MPYDTIKYVPSFQIVECAQCGERLFLPERSEFIDERCARYLWQCESCDYSFETTVCFADVAA
jgi:hypothetical protein